MEQNPPKSKIERGSGRRLLEEMTRRLKVAKPPKSKMERGSGRSLLEEVIKGLKVAKRKVAPRLSWYDRWHQDLVIRSWMKLAWSSAP